MRNRLFMSGAVALALMLGLTGSALAEGKTMRPEVGKPLQAAVAALKDGKPQQALQDIQQADAISNKTAYEESVILQLRQSAYLKLNDWANVAHVTDEILASSDPGNTVQQYQILAEAYLQLKDYGRTTDAVTKYYRAGGTDPRYHAIIIQAYYLAGNYAEAAKASRAAIIETEKAGQKPTEADLQLLQSAEFKMLPSTQSSPGYIDALLRIVQYYPKPAYWHDLVLASVKRPGFSDKLDLDVDAIRVQAGVDLGADEYMEAAEAQIQAGYPNNAKMILDQGTKNGVLGTGPQAARAKKLEDLAQRQIADDQKSLAGEEAAAKTGSQWAKLADAYESYGETDKALPAYQKALQADAFKSPTEGNIAKLHEARALAAAGQKAQAKQVFASLSGATDGSAELALVWAALLGVR